MIDDLPVPSSSDIEQDKKEAIKDSSLDPLEDYSRVQRAKDLARTGLQGLGMGFSDEAIAKVRSMIEGKSYEEVLDEERSALKRFKEAFPKTALTAEIGGAALGGIALGPVAGAAGEALGIGAGAARATTTGGRVIQELGTAASLPGIKPVLTGAATGAVEELGKAEKIDTTEEGLKESAWGAAKGALGGAAVGAVVKAVPAGIAWAAGKLKKPGELSKSGKAAYDIAKETGKEVTDPGGEKVLGEVSQDLTEKLIGARNKIKTRFDGLFERAEEEGVTIPISKSITDTIEKYSHYLSADDNRKFAQILDKMDALGSSISPRDAGSLKFMLGSIAQQAEKGANAPGLIPGIDAAKAQLTEAFSKNLKGYNLLTAASNKLYQTIESIVNRGAQGLAQTGEQTIEKGAQGYFQKVGKNIDPISFNKSARGFLARGGLENSSTDTLKTTKDLFNQRLGELETIEKDLVHNFGMPKSESFFSHFGDSAENLSKQLSKNLDFTALRARKIGQKSITEEAGIPISKEDFKHLFKGGLTDRLGIFIGETTGKYSTADVLLGGAFKGAANITEKLAKTPSLLPDFALGAVAANLLDYPTARPYAEMMQKGLKEGDLRAKNTALFALQNNPQTRSVFKNEVEQYVARNVASSNSVDFSTGDSKSKEWETDQKYIDKRNQFLKQVESGPEEADQDEFKTYADSRGNMTIGHGFNMDAGARMGALSTLKNVLNISDRDARDIYMGKKTIDRDQAESLLSHSISKAERILDEKLSSIGDVKITPNQRAALVSMIYNNPSLVGNKILSALSKGDMAEVSRLISITSDHQRRVAPGLPIRRRKEAALFSSED